MTARNKNQPSGLRMLSIGLVVLSVVHIPLPQADYHNVRHHDGPGEICAHHDHLLRWHPSAGTSADLSLLHWHWFLPLLEPANTHQSPSDDDHHRPGSGPALHAHVGDGLAPDEWRGEPVIESAASWRLIDQLALDISVLNADHLSAPSSSKVGAQLRRSSSRWAGPAGRARAPRRPYFSSTGIAAAEGSRKPPRRAFFGRAPPPDRSTCWSDQMGVVTTSDHYCHSARAASSCAGSSASDIGRHFLSRFEVRSSSGDREWEHSPCLLH